MSEDDSTFDELGGRRDYPRVALVAVAMLGVLLATTAVPVLSPAGANSPVSSMVPIPEQVRGGDSAGAAGEAAAAGSGMGGTSGLGALSPGDSTNVGGALGGETPLNSNSSEVHFRVESTQGSYWRTGAYGEYTGSGWERASDTQPVDGGIPVEGQRGTRVAYEVTLERGAASLPTVWQPAEISRENVGVTANGAITTENAVPQGTTYSGVSYKPPNNPNLLRAAGQDYPAAVEDRYTQLPADRPERLAAFTDNLTANASTNYDEAKRIERWLEENKEYSLNASHDQSSDEGIATQFVFDMDVGYCEYFATSMVAMLRTQDIPARYVVGYSTGEPTGDGEYVVRGMNAHAWVEVYFPDVGWVRFDPTPANERLQAESEELDVETPTPSGGETENGSGFTTSTQTTTPTNTPVRGSAGNGTADVTVTGTSTASGTGTGSPSGTGTGTGTGTASGTGTGTGTASGSETGTATGTESQSTTTTTAPESAETPTETSTESGSTETETSTGTGTTTESESATATPTPTPTATPTPTPTPTANESTENETDPVYQISLNRTAVPGTTVLVNVTEDGVPVADAQVLFNGEPVGVTTTAGTVIATVPYVSTLNVTVDGNANERVLSYGAPTRDNGRLFRPAQPTVRDTETYELNTTAGIVISGPVRTNSEIGLTALVDGEPVPNATVTLDGEEVGTTDGNGWATVQLPSEPGNVTLAVERGAVSGNRTLTLGALNVTVEAEAPLALPFTDATVNATIAGEPTGGVAVTRGGTQVATTGPDGTATVTLPLAQRAELGATHFGQTETRTLEGLYTNLAIVAAGALALLVVVVALARRYGLTPRRFARALVSLGQLIVGIVVAIGSGLDTLFRRLYRRAILTVEHLRALVRGAASPAALLAALRSWFEDRTEEVQQTVADGVETVNEVRTVSLGADQGPQDPHATIREAWSQFLDHVSLSRPSRRTPETIATHAIEVDGLPPSAVRTLVDAFRDVEYGQRDPTERVPTVDEAIDEIERAVADPEETESADPSGGEAGVAD